MIKKIWIIALLFNTLIFVNACKIKTNEVINAPVEPPKINYFMINNQILTPGQSALLYWSVSGADSITIEPGIGNVDPNGSLTVTPANSTTYVLTALNHAGSNIKAVKVNIVEYTDSSDCIIIGCDPTSGKNQSILIDLEQLCLSTEYQVQIAKNPEFSLVLFDSGAYAPYSKTSPSFIYPPGGIFECGQKYYVRFRVRSMATGQTIISPWSSVECYAISPGFSVTAATD